MGEGDAFKHLADELEYLVTTAFERLEGLDDTQTSVRPSPKAWSKKEILGHLIDSASNNHQRFVRAQCASKLAFPPYAQEQWVDLQRYNRADWGQMLAFWRLYNLHLAHIVRQIPAGKMSVPCTIGTEAPVTLAFLVEDYLAHMRLHFEQLELAV